MTGAAVQALCVAGRCKTEAVRRAIAYLREHQQPDGGWQSGDMADEQQGESNSGTTPWVVQALWAVGEDPATWKKPGGKDPLGCPDLGLEVCNYHTDSMSEQVANEIRGSDKPFYIQLDYHTPHGDSRPPIGPEPAIRDYDTALKTPTPNPPGFNEADVSDKPWFLRDLTSRLTAGEIQQLTIENRKSVEALQSVDRGVKKIVDTLSQTGKLRNTYIIYTSDNGFFLGQHRIHRGKLLFVGTLAELRAAQEKQGLRLEEIFLEMVG